MTNYELFKQLREDFFCELNDSSLNELEKSEVREYFTSSFMRTLFYFIENGKTVNTD